MDLPRRRLGHKKSRNGCVRCKARRVKCDERRPCSNCVRHRADCSLLSTCSPQLATPTSPASAVAGSERPTPRQPSEDGNAKAFTLAHGTHLAATPPQVIIPHLSADWRQHLRSPPSPASTSRVDALTPDTPNPNPANRHFSPDWLQSLRLMHHYCTSTCRVLPSEDGTEELWTVAIPEAAASHEFLMHGLLALSALHYGHVHPEQRREYNLVSAHYQALMLPYFATRLNGINDENCEAYFFLASLIFLLSLCWVTHHETLERTAGPDDIAQSFALLQGVKGILDFRPIEKWKESGPLSSLFRVDTDLGQPAGNRPFLTRLDKVITLVRQLPMSLEVINPQSACFLALEALRSTYWTVRSTDRPSSVWKWPIGLPVMFIEMISNNHPAALIILAHYAALVWPCERRTWASRGWSRGVIIMVERLLDQESQAWIQWPKRSVVEEKDIDEMSE